MKKTKELEVNIRRIKSVLGYVGDTDILTDAEYVDLAKLLAQVDKEARIDEIEQLLALLISSDAKAPIAITTKDYLNGRLAALTEDTDK